MKSSLVELTQVYGAADVLQQAGQLRGLQVGERRLVLGDPLVQVGQFALDGLLHSPLPRLQLGVLRVSGGRQECHRAQVWDELAAPSQSVGALRLTFAPG